MDRKMQSFKPVCAKEEEPARAVLAVKRQPIKLAGKFADYAINIARDTVEVEGESGFVTMTIPVEKIDLFIEELQAIQRNIGSDKPLPFWG